MWPHASVPSATVLVQAADAACPGKFTLEGIENHAARKQLHLSPLHLVSLLIVYCSLLQTTPARSANGAGA